ncbi:leucine-rich repeat-containing G-protein coupled receptor 5-like [Cotesia glomerata]|uniref:leucine-rich repeat-containing G-protein coupled receptor 5-like n=1 Tax=Cotesia glomerata TaxID=32391 RepID=UPI001D02CE2A|nr:leucine-rich repeat-containing G-protein coupled receptor 5-like [Cotesia glomerata]
MASNPSTLAIFLIYHLTVSSSGFSNSRVSFPLTYVDYSIPIPESGKILLPTGKCEDIKDRDLSLYLPGCAPVTLYPGFIDSCRVSCLCLSDSSISKISVGSFDKLPNLEYLDLSRNRIQLCDFLSFGGHQKLVTLIIDENDSGLREQVLSESDCFPKLEHLYLRKNNIADITIPLQRTFPSLTHLYLSDNKLKGRTFEYLDLPLTLTHLHLERNQINRLDTRGLINLSSLFLDGNRIQSLSHLPCLDESNLSLRHATRLRFLSLSQNMITSVQRDSFDDCRALKSLNLAHNRISSIPFGTFDGLSELRDLSLSYNQLTSLPDFRNVRVLTSLSLDHNLIEYIPSGAFCDLGELKWLSLGNNRIKNVFVEAFVNLDSLEEIDLSYNELTYLPYGWIRGSTRLKHLDVRGNRFTRIEDLALDCTVSLKYLYLQGNPLDRYTPGYWKIKNEVSVYLEYESSVRREPCNVRCGVKYREYVIPRVSYSDEWTW